MNFRSTHFPLILCLLFLALINGKSNDVLSNHRDHNTGLNGRISVSTDTMDFDTVFVGASVTDQFTIINVGSDSLNIYDIFTNSIYFNLQNFHPFILAPQALNDITVEFTPYYAGFYLDTLTIHSSDTLNPSLHIILIGYAVDASVVIVNLYPPHLSVPLPSLGDSSDYPVLIHSTWPTMWSVSPGNTLPNLISLFPTNGGTVLNQPDTFFVRIYGIDPNLLTQNYFFLYLLYTTNDPVIPFVELQYGLELILPNSINNLNTEILKGFKLQQNFPNPFNNRTQIWFSIFKKSRVQLSVLDIHGKEIEVLLEEDKIPGNYQIYYDGSNLSSGIYFYILNVDGNIETKKFILIK